MNLNQQHYETVCPVICMSCVHIPIRANFIELKIRMLDPVLMDDREKDVQHGYGQFE